MVALRWRLQATDVAQVVHQHEVGRFMDEGSLCLPAPCPECGGGTRRGEGRTTTSAGFCHIVARGTTMRSSGRVCDHMLVQFDPG